MTYSYTFELQIYKLFYFKRNIRYLTKIYVKFINWKYNLVVFGKSFSNINTILLKSDI